MNKLKAFNAVLMIAGTSVGTGILGLPIASSSSGLIPTMCAFIISWIFMTVAAFYILEVKMQVRGNYNLSSMIHLTLGNSGKIFSAIIIVLLLYALLCTYMMAGSAWLQVLVSDIIELPNLFFILAFTIIFGLVIYPGERLIYNINNLLALCLIIAFAVTVGANLIPNNFDFIKQSNFSKVFSSFPLLLTTFGFSIIVPTVTEYLDYNKRAAKIAIFIGSLLALIAYIVWDWVMLANIPLNGENSFAKLTEGGDNGTGVILAFAAVTHNHIVNVSGRIFAIFAAITSFMGVSLALLHFLADNFNIIPNGRKRMGLLLLIYIPTILITCLLPNAFVQVLGFAGIFVALLLGLIPVLMRYTIKGKSNNNSSRFNNLFLTVNALFFIFVIIQETINLLK